MDSDDRSFLLPGLWAGGSVALGSALGLSLASGSRSVTVAAGASLLVGMLLAVRSRRSIVRAVALVCAFTSAGFIAGLVAPRPGNSSAIDHLADQDKAVRFSGRLVEPVQHRLAPPRWKSSILQPRLSVLVDIDHVWLDDAWHEAGGVRALLGGEDAELHALAGDAVEGVAHLSRPHAPKNPGEDDARPRLTRRAIAYVGTLQRGALITTEPRDSIARRSELFRGSFGRFLRERMDDPDRVALVAALSVGERGGVTPTLNEAFNASGLAHVLSISGLHLAVAVLALAWLLRRIFGLVAPLSDRIAPRALAAWVTLPITAAYVIFVGAPAPAVRAGLGTGLLLLGRALGRSTDALHTLGWTLALVAAFDPASLFEPSAQLSFLGVFGLAYLSPRLRELVPMAPASADAGRLVQLREAILGLAVGSIAATLATAPVTAAYFERTSLVAALANIVAWPASTLIVPAGALSAAVFPFSPAIAGPLADLAGICAWMLSACAKVFASWPSAAIVVDPPTVPTVIAYGLFVIGAVHLRRWPWKRAAILAAIGATGLIAGAIPRSSATGELELTFLSVGQGDSTFIRFPGGSTMLVDAGGDASMRYDPGARVVAPFLRHSAISKIDVMVASHPHPDHIGGLPSVLARFPVGEFWHDGEHTDDGPQADLIELARESGTTAVEFKQGLPPECPELPPLDQANPEVAELAVGDPRCRPPPPERMIDGVRVQILHPLNGPSHSAYPELGENDNSLVLRLTHGQVSVLLPGDLETEGESILVSSGYDLSADLIKAPHHGSRTSSSGKFLRVVRPKFVVFCVGEKNVFGFPKPEIVDRYAAAGCRRFRTDEGPVTFVSDGQGLHLKEIQGSPIHHP